MGLVITAGIASAGAGGIVTLFASLGIRARRAWNAQRRADLAARREAYDEWAAVYADSGVRAEES